MMQDLSDNKSKQTPCFCAPRLHETLESMDEGALDLLPFGVIRMSRFGIVTGYNLCESEAAGISPSKVIGQHCFRVVAPCTNNFMVASRFEDEETLDCFLDFIFTLKMRPTPVELRLLKSENSLHMYMLIRRK